MTDWRIIIAAMRVQSGEPAQNRMSDDMAAFLDERFGIDLSPGDRTFTTLTPRVDFENGLTDAEVAAVEIRFAFRFPPDLRALLQTALPVGDDFPNWRQSDGLRLRDWLDAPMAGLCFDVEHNDFWDPEWGERPARLEKALDVCRELVMQAPRMIPIYGHRYIAAEPDSKGNPVFSIHQTDIIHYGHDLEDYLRREFELGGRTAWPNEVRRIRFWDIDRWQDISWCDNGREFWHR